MADALKAQIEAQGEAVRKLKTEKADAASIKAAVVKLLALKAEYKQVTGEDYQAPGAASSSSAKEKPAKAKPPAPQPEKAGPSKKELKKAEKKDKKTAAKAGAKEAGNGGKPAAAAGAPAGAGGAKAAGPAAAPTATAAAKVTEPTLYPGEDSDSTHTVLAVVHAGKAKLARGYGSKPGFFGKGPFLELPDGEVVSGVEGVVRAVALLFAPSLDAGRPAVDDWVEWAFRRLKPAVTAASASENAADLIHQLTVLEKALSGGAGQLVAGGQGPSLADLVVAPIAKQALGFFGEHEYVQARQWAGVVLGGPLFQETAALLGSKGPFRMSDRVGPAQLDPRLGLQAVLEAVFTAAVHRAFPQLAGDAAFRVADVAKCGNPAMGDYQCNSAMALYRALKASGQPDAPARPQDAAQRVIEHLPALATRDILAEVSVAGAGFINVRVQEAYLKARVRDVLEHGPQAAAPERLRVLVDFSSPNIAKEMHVGHLRSTILGDSICRMLEFLGHDVMRTNHVGDWGTQFGMLILYLKEEYPDFLSNPPNITDLTTFYKNAKRRFDESEDFKEKARNGVVELQAGNPESRAIWRLLCDISRKEFQKVYDRLEVRLEECGESFYNEMIPGAIEALRGKGLLQEDNGALIMWCGPKYQIPLMVRKSDGGYGYDSTDLAAVRYRLEQLRRDWVIYITDAGQALHFHMVFDAARLVGWAQDARHRLDHVGFGVVQGEDGKRFKTRSGDTVRLVDLLDEAVHRMSASLLERIRDGKATLTEAEAREAANALGYGAVKYADLKQNPTTDYQFSYDRMLDTKGDTAIYLLFTCARFHSILRKAEEEKGINVKELVAASEVVLEHPTERALALELAQFPEALHVAVSELMPSRICSYVFGLASKATDFLEACYVLTSPHRLLLVQATTAVMVCCLQLLGIQPITKI